MVYAQSVSLYVGVLLDILFQLCLAQSDKKWLAKQNMQIFYIRTIYLAISGFAIGEGQGGAMPPTLHFSPYYNKGTYI